ncbi:MAG: AMP-binding protein [Lachnospiraceae bacterium]|nr:AMP-binding protein [Lachnospiraceae bacterium]
MLGKILNNLKKYPEDECYQINRRIYKNRDLYKYVCNIYHYLLGNCSYQDRIAVCGHKEIYMVASFLACSFAGMAYVPIDISIPAGRKEKIIKQVHPGLVIDSGINEVMDKDAFEEISDIFLKPDDLFYIIYTSGSSGEPKGVQIAYRNLISCMDWLVKICDVSNDIILNQANYSFDLSVADIYLSLLTRSRHYIIERDTQRDFPMLFSELKKSGSGLAVMTPSYAEYLMADKSFDHELMPDLKTILFCGENLSGKTAEKLYDRFPGLRIINCYGPTECTFAVTGNIVDPGEKISIGLPKDDVDIYIVDENLEPVNDNEIGEIVVTGESVGKGYVDKELNKGVFITFMGKNAYVTGDLACRENGKLYFIGRKDRQIKYKGFRVELPEIEKALDGLDYIEKAVVTTKVNEEGTVNRIIAFVMLKEDCVHNIQDIRKHLGESLPDYMMPVIKIVDRFPLDDNGKLDERILMKE